MGRQIEIIEVIGGMNKFKEICSKHFLNSEEINVFKMVLRGYENTDKKTFDENNKEKDAELRKKAREAVFPNAVKRLKLFSRKKLCPPLAEIEKLELEILNLAKALRNQ